MAEAIRRVLGGHARRLSGNGGSPLHSRGQSGGQPVVAVAVAHNVEPSAPELYEFPAVPTQPVMGYPVAPPMAPEVSKLEQPVPVVQAWSVPLPPKAETRSSNEDPLMLAAYRGDATTVEALIGGYNVKTRNRYGETLLHLAASAPEGEAVKVVAALVKAGAAINATDFLQKTPLHVASLAGNGGAVKKLLLLDAGNSLDRPSS
jgi:hypothetical protein